MPGQPQMPVTGQRKTRSNRQKDADSCPEYKVSQQDRENRQQMKYTQQQNKCL